MAIQQMIVLGAKRSKGSLDNGNTYNSTKIYTQTQMEQKDGQVGFASAEFVWGDSTNFEKIAHLKFPFPANVDIETSTNGKTLKLIVLDVQPIQTQTIQTQKEPKA